MTFKNFVYMPSNVHLVDMHLFLFLLKTRIQTTYNIIIIILDTCRTNNFECVIFKLVDFLHLIFFLPCLDMSGTYKSDVYIFCYYLDECKLLYLFVIWRSIFEL